MIALAIGQTILPHPNNCERMWLIVPVSPPVTGGSRPNDIDGSTAKNTTSANPTSDTPIRSSLRSRSSPCLTMRGALVVCGRARDVERAAFGPGGPAALSSSLPRRSLPSRPPPDFFSGSSRRPPNGERSLRSSGLPAAGRSAGRDVPSPDERVGSPPGPSSSSSKGERRGGVLSPRSSGLRAGPPKGLRSRSLLTPSGLRCARLRSLGPPPSGERYELSPPRGGGEDEPDSRPGRASSSSNGLLRRGGIPVGRALLLLSGLSSLLRPSTPPSRPPFFSSFASDLPGRREGAAPPNAGRAGRSSFLSSLPRPGRGSPNLLPPESFFSGLAGCLSLLPNGSPIPRPDFLSSS